MSEPRPQPERIDLACIDDVRDVIHRAVACLAQGGIVGLPTETVYGLTACALHAEAVERLRRLKRLDQVKPLTMLLRGPDEVTDWVPNLPELGRRLARRAWPGPVTLMVPDSWSRGLSRQLPDRVRPLISPDDSVLLRVPAHPLIRDIARLIPGPLVLSMVPTPDNTGATTADPLEHLGELNMILDDGPTQWGCVSTIVRVDPTGWSIVRPGAISSSAVSRMTARIFLFVCTGNTCRSPMAAALCKIALAKRLGCDPEELEDHGYVILSAGIAAMTGMPAAAHAIEIVRGFGGSLAEHTSQPLSTDLARQADLIVTMTGDHLESLLERFPDAAPRARLLDPEGADIADPIGSDRETYQQTANEIEEFLHTLLDEIL
jgi:protein-tyrosine phosphatase